MVALPQSKLKQTWVRHAIAACAKNLIENRHVASDCGPLFPRDARPGRLSAANGSRLPGSEVQFEHQTLGAGQEADTPGNPMKSISQIDGIALPDRHEPRADSHSGRSGDESRNRREATPAAAVGDRGRKGIEASTHWCGPHSFAGKVFGLAFATSALLYLHRYVFGFIKPTLKERGG